ncbi:MAG: hypothetical protein HW402_29 [Dehalococcoidales bacterium]|nr:hypothetical protein [Dehalococcoidales bacterium]
MCSYNYLMINEKPSLSLTQGYISGHRITGGIIQDSMN